MKRASKFVISPHWKLMLTDMGIDMVQVLKIANLPADLFNRGNMALSPVEYFRLWQAIEQVSEKDIALLLAQAMTVEAFDAPIFASICSPNLNTALLRLQQYKPLIGPMLLTLDINEKFTELTIECYGAKQELPSSLALVELVFFTQLARLATREKIVPLRLYLPQLPENISPYHDYFGCQLICAEKVSIRFSSIDAQMPFLTANATMWEFFEDKLNKRLSDMQSSATTVDRVKAILMEALPSGQSSIEHVADKLAMSKRTLQRKLTQEAESYQSVLQWVRSELADHYLDKSQLSLAEISFLLGFTEPNSFIRAYSHWNGISPGQYRESCH